MISILEKKWIIATISSPRLETNTKAEKYLGCYGHFSLQGFWRTVFKVKRNVQSCGCPNCPRWAGKSTLVSADFSARSTPSFQSHKVPRFRVRWAPGAGGGHNPGCTPVLPWQPVQIHKLRHHVSIDSKTRMMPVLAFQSSQEAETPALMLGLLPRTYTSASGVETSMGHCAKLGSNRSAVI